MNKERAYYCYFFVFEKLTKDSEVFIMIRVFSYFRHAFNIVFWCISEILFRTRQLSDFVVTMRPH